MTATERDHETTPDTAPEASAGPWSSRELAVRIACFVDEKLADDIVVLEVGPTFQVTDYFVIASGQNRRHLSAMAENAAKELKQHGIYRIGGSSLSDENWVLLDFGAVVLHAFSTEARSYYDLENLWGDCPKVDWRAERMDGGPTEAPVRPARYEPEAEELEPDDSDSVDADAVSSVPDSSAPDTAVAEHGDESASAAD